MVALTVVVLTSLVFICVGDVNFLAPIVTMPFLITYVTVDYAYFALAMTADLKTNTKNSSAHSSTSQKLLDPSSNTYGSLENKEEPTDPDYER